MVGRDRERRLPRQFQEPRQLLGLASEFLANGGDLAPLPFRFEGSDQPLEPRAQLGGAERLVIGEPGKIAEQPAQPAQSDRLRFLHPFPRGAPLGRDLVIEKREAPVHQPQQREAQKTGHLDRAMRILDPRQRCRFSRIVRRAKYSRPASGKSGRISRSEPNSLRNSTFSICSERPLAVLLDGTAPSHSRRLTPPSSIGANRRGTHASHSSASPLQ